MTLLRRYLVVYSLMVWQGGFVFYSAIVVPIGTATLGSAAAQGAITARVTEVMYVIGLFSLGLLLWDMLVSADPSPRRRYIRWACWLIAVLSHGLLLYCHFLLLSLMDPDRRYVIIHTPFYLIHRIYLWICTFQWIAVSLWLLLTVKFWNNFGNGKI
jgi:hypothetical protein